MDEFEALREELEHYKVEKERIRDIVGQIGGKFRRKHRMAMNVGFLVLVVGLFLVDFCRHAFDWHIRYLPPMVLLEVAVLLVSLKIIWMIHNSAKVEHFQFHILNSIEFRLNQISRRIAALEELLSSQPAQRDSQAENEMPLTVDGDE